MNGRLMISVWPKFYAATEHFKEFYEKGWMYQQAIKDSIKDWVGPGYLGSFYDAYDADVYKRQIIRLMLFIKIQTDSCGLVQLRG